MTAGASDDTPNVAALLARAAERFPERLALATDGPRGPETITFGALWDAADRAGAALRARGLEPGERAILMIPMSIDLYVALVAVLKAGAVAVFVDPWIGRREIAAFAAFAEPRAWIGSPASHLLRLLEPSLRRIRLTVTTGARLGVVPARHSLRALRAAPADGVIWPAAAEDSALITFTSGSSGMPKGADRTHGFLAAQQAALAAEFPRADGDVDMTTFPVFALSNLAAGIPTVIPRMDFRRVDEVDPAVVLEEMSRWGVTTCTASPPFFDRLAAWVRVRPGRMPNLRRILTGGAPVLDEELAAWRRVFRDTEIVVVYGSTEAEPVAHVDARERLAAAAALGHGARGICTGTPGERVRARVVRLHEGPIAVENGSLSAWEVPRGAVGELVVDGDHVCKSYFRNPEAVRENKVVDGEGTVWHRMGDTGYFDAAGRFWLVGRVHSAIRRGGETVHTLPIEQVARQADGRIRRAAAVGVPDNELGERVVVVLETDAAYIADSVRRRLEEAGLPVDRVEVLAALPVDPRHKAKIDYPALRRVLLGGAAGSGGAAGAAGAAGITGAAAGE
jgi:acyl-CoA synthetase (AMP-forming)/AMP-acid ligase II